MGSGMIESFIYGQPVFSIPFAFFHIISRAISRQHSRKKKIYIYISSWIKGPWGEDRVQSCDDVGHSGLISRHLIPSAAWFRLESIGSQLGTARTTGFFFCLSGFFVASFLALDP
jgi:hypothetical protein